MCVHRYPILAVALVPTTLTRCYAPRTVAEYRDSCATATAQTPKSAEVCQRYIQLLYCCVYSRRGCASSCESTSTYSCMFLATQALATFDHLSRRSHTIFTLLHSTLAPRVWSWTNLSPGVLDRNMMIASDAHEVGACREIYNESVLLVAAIRGLALGSLVCSR